MNQYIPICQNKFPLILLFIRVVHIRFLDIDFRTANRRKLAEFTGRRYRSFWQLLSFFFVLAREHFISVRVVRRGLIAVPVPVAMSTLPPVHLYINWALQSAMSSRAACRCFCSSSILASGCDKCDQNMISSISQHSNYTVLMLSTWTQSFRVSPQSDLRKYKYTRFYITF